MLSTEILVFVWVPLVVIVAIKQMRRNASFSRTFGILVLTTYICALIAVTLFPLPFQAKLLHDMRDGGSMLSNNFQPFRTVNDVLSLGVGISLRQLGGNLLLLVPLTFLLPALWKRFRTFKSILLVAATVSCSIEFLQFTISAILGFTYKVTDIDDFILNVCGATIGYGFYLIIKVITRMIYTKSNDNRLARPRVEQVAE